MAGNNRATLFAGPRAKLIPRDLGGALGNVYRAVRSQPNINDRRINANSGNNQALGQSHDGFHIWVGWGILGVRRRQCRLIKEKCASNNSHCCNNQYTNNKKAFVCHGYVVFLKTFKSPPRRAGSYPVILSQTMSVLKQPQPRLCRLKWHLWPPAVPCRFQLNRIPYSANLELPPLEQR